MCDGHHLSHPYRAVACPTTSSRTVLSVCEMAAHNHNRPLSSTYQVLAAVLRAAREFTHSIRTAKQVLLLSHNSKCQNQSTEHLRDLPNVTQLTPRRGRSNPKSSHLTTLLTNSETFSSPRCGGFWPKGQRYRAHPRIFPHCLFFFSKMEGFGVLASNIF